MQDQPDNAGGEGQPSEASPQKSRRARDRATGEGPKHRRRWPFIAAGAAVVAIGLGSAYWFVWRSDAQASENQAQTTTVTASLGTFDKTVSASGTLTPAVSEDLSFDAKGTVQSVDVQAGDTVEAGQTLATIDTLQLTADLLQAQADLADAQSTLSQAKADGDSSTKIAAAQAQVEVAQANADTAAANMANATLVAPVAGQITAVNIAVGDVVGSSSSASGSGSQGSDPGATGGTGGSGNSGSAGTSTAAFSIVGTDSWSIDLSVSAADLANLEVGDQAEIAVDGVDDQVFGTITSLGRVASTSSGSATFPVTVAVTGTPEGLYDGVSATVDLIYERRMNVLSIPSAAVQTTDGATTVLKLVDGEAVETPVELGETNGSSVEITSGLAEGDDVQITVTLPSQNDSDSDTGTGDQQMPGGGQFPGGGEMPDGGFVMDGTMPQRPGGSNG